MAEASKAQKMFEDGHACSQAVLTAFAHRYNLPEELALKLSCSFGGGMGRQGCIFGILFNQGKKLLSGVLKPTVIDEFGYAILLRFGKGLGAEY